jgi:hypothetical protein
VRKRFHHPSSEQENWGASNSSFETPDTQPMGFYIAQDGFGGTNGVTAALMDKYPQWKCG